MRLVQLKICGFHFFTSTRLKPQQQAGHIAFCLLFLPVWKTEPLLSDVDEMTDCKSADTHKHKSDLLWKNILQEVSSLFHGPFSYWKEKKTVVEWIYSISQPGCILYKGSKRSLSSGNQLSKQIKLSICKAREKQDALDKKHKSIQTLTWELLLKKLWSN